jgi:hypothetical protein
MQRNIGKKTAKKHREKNCKETSGKELQTKIGKKNANKNREKNCKETSGKKLQKKKLKFKNTGQQSRRECEDDGGIEWLQNQTRRSAKDRGGG